MSEEPEQLAMVELDTDLCLGIGACEELAAKHFTVDIESGMARYVDGVPTMPLSEAQALVDNCPNQALSLKLTS